MAVLGSSRDNEFNNFVLDSDTEVARRVLVKNSASQPIPVYIQDGPADSVVNVYSTVSSVSSATLTTVVSYTVPAGMTLNLKQAQFTGSNIATYSFLIDSTEEAKHRTWFGGDLSGSLDFFNLEIGAASVVELKVIHARPFTGDFEARFVGFLE